MTVPRQLGAPFMILALTATGLALGCGSPSSSSPLTLRGSVPCPPGSGSVETWCDDAGRCELRVTTGGVFSCDPGSATGCTAATDAAVAACRRGGVPDGGGTIRDGAVPPRDGPAPADPCEDYCRGCPGSACTGCRAERETPAFVACESEWLALAGCSRANGCEPSLACEAETVAWTACLCASEAPRLAEEARLCGHEGRTWTCGSRNQQGFTALCGDSFDMEGCAAFSSYECSPCPGEESCGGECVDTFTDARHCGGCGRVCGAGTACDRGECVPTTCTIAGESSAWPALPSVCLPRCTGETYDALFGCTTEACVTTAFDADPTPPVELELPGGVTEPLDCEGCVLRMSSSCLHDQCPVAHAAYRRCYDLDPSTASSRCARESSALDDCLVEDELADCNSARVLPCFDFE